MVMKTLNDFPVYAYCVNNMYFMGIQAGIQSAHSLAEATYTGSALVHREITSSLKLTSRKSKLFYRWFHDHKAMVVTNGGPSVAMREFLSLLQSYDSDFVFEPFYETDLAEDALSNICVIAPSARDVIDHLLVKMSETWTKEDCIAFCGSEANYNILSALSSMRLAS